MKRASGILMHPTSLPGKFGIGEFDHSAYKFLDLLAEMGQQLWQVMPLGPTGYGDSPYQCFSAFAGNPLLISLETLVAEGALDVADLQGMPEFPPDRVDFGPVITFKQTILRKSYAHFAARAGEEQRVAFAKFCNDNASWLDDYALFMALKNAHNGNVWNTWKKDIAMHDPEAVAYWRMQLREEVEAQQYYQFQFFRQWFALKRYANEKGIKIIGDIPIFVAFDSADAWANRDQFYFDEHLQPTVVAGVPPDYFSPTGQRWGNPLYRWDVMEQRGFDWWIRRVKSALDLYDIVRVDHFRGFEAYWEVPATEATAVNGRWVKGPCDALFEAVRNALGDVPVVAENLGVITDEVEALRKHHGFPGMAVLQFAFGKDAAHSGLLPHKWEHDTVAYTGTADNDTTIGWWKAEGGSTQDRKAVKAERAYAKQYLDTTGKDIQWVCIRTVMASVADTAIFPLQDVLGLDTDARMNLPGSFGGHNWTWRYRAEQLTDDLADRLRGLAEIFGRCLSAD